MDLFGWGKIVINVGTSVYKFKNRQDLENYCDQIISEYHLVDNETPEDFLKRFERVPSDKKTIFLKCYPDIYEYLDHARKHPGIPFKQCPYCNK